MPAPKGHKPYGSRRKGVGNKAKGLYEGFTVAEIFKLKKFSAIESLVEMAQEAETPIEIRAKILCELANYEAPKRKAIEVTGQGGQPLINEIVVRVVSPGDAG